MSESDAVPIFFADDSDPDMQRAYEQARATFRYFWREVAWEQRRIIPGLDLACVKAPFQDPSSKKKSTEQPQAEQMWMGDVSFDGKLITATLLNSPRWITSVSEGDEIRLPIHGITDWMYAIHNRVYGGYTVNVMRARMEVDEREQHDAAWGLDFGDPNVTHPIPPSERGGSIDLEADHPMAINMADSIVEFLKQDPNNIHWKDDNGWTLLHQLSLAGSDSCVTVLLKNGADPNAVTEHGMTPLQLARSLKWSQVEQLLIENGAH